MLIQLQNSALAINPQYISNVRWDVNTTYRTTKINDPKEVLELHIYMTNGQAINILATEDIFKLVQSVPGLEWPKEETPLMKRANERYQKHNN